MACLAKDPRDRPGSALDLILELDEMTTSRGAFDDFSTVPFRRSGVVPAHA
jgi:hypothetical protein